MKDKAISKLLRLKNDFAFNLFSKIKSNAGQGTAEYAILVGVLVVAAIAIMVAVGGKITELWTEIQNGLNQI